MSAFVKMKELLEIIGMSRSALYERMDENGPRFDPTFPKPVRIGAQSTKPMLRWSRRDVENWLAEMGAETSKANTANNAEREIERLGDAILRANRFFEKGWHNAGREELHDLAHSIEEARKRSHYA